VVWRVEAALSTIVLVREDLRTVSPFIPRPWTVLFRPTVAAGLITIVLESLTLVGWNRGLPLLTEIFPSLPPVPPRESLTLVLAGLVLLGLEISPAPPVVEGLCLIGACLVVLSAVLSLLQFVGIWPDGIDTLINRLITGSDSPIPAPAPSVFLTILATPLLGGALLAIAAHVRGESYLSQALCLIAFAIGLGTLYAYAYGATLVSHPSLPSPFAGVTLSGALGFWALGLGILARQPNRGFLGVITSHGPARTLANILVVLSITAPLVLGAFAMAGERFGLYDIPSAVAFASIGSTLALGLLGLIVVHAFHRHDALLTATMRIADTIASAYAEPREVLQTIVAEAQTVGSKDYVALGLDGDAHQPFDPWVFRGVSAEQAAAIGPFPRPVGLLGAVITGSAPIRLGNLFRDPPFRGFPAHHPPMRAFLGLPVYFHNHAVGNLYLARRAGEVSFSAEDERIVGVLASHAGAVLEEGRLRALLAEERVRLQTVLDTAPVGIVFVDAATDRVVANTRASQLFGFPIIPEAGRTQFLGRRLDPQGRGLPLEALPSSRALQGETVEAVDLLFVQPDGSRTPIRENAAPLYNTRGRVNGAVFVVEDVTAQKQLERERSEWTAVITHDLRQPVTVILGYATFLHRHLERAGGEDDDRRAAEHILTSARNLSRMVSDLLDVARIESRRLTIRPQPTDLPALVQQVLDRNLQVTVGHPIQLQIDEAIPLLEVDPARIEQVIGNLLSNAAKYSEPATPIGITVERREAEVEVAVSNSGPGIAPEEVSRLFERFYRTQEAQAGERPGIGLGLYITKGLVEAHGGRIWVESVPGQITTFHITLPIPS
jgi:PAS domain S-box-containing protein